MELKQVFDKNCTLCHLSATCKSVCMVGKGKPTSKLMVVVEVPSYYDEQNNTIGEAEKDQLLKGIMSDVLKIDMSDVYFTFAVKCRPTDGRVATDKEIESCYTYLEQEIKLIQPKCILVVGGSVSKYITGVDDIMARLRDKIHHKEIDGIQYPVVCTFSPAYVARTEGQIQNFAKDLHRAWTIAQGQVEDIRITQVVQVETVEQVKELVEYIKETGVCTYDFETTGLDWYKGRDIFKATAIAFSFQVGSAWVIPLEHKDSPFIDGADKIMRYLAKNVFENPDIRKIAHNAKFDMHIARVYGVGKFAGRLDDTMVMSHCWDETVRHGLKELGQNYFPQFAGYENEVKQHNWADVPLDVLCKYAGSDTDLTMRLAIQLESQLMTDERLYRLYRNLQMAFLRPAFEAEHGGMLIDRDFLQQSIDDARELISRVQARLKQHPTILKFESAERERFTQEAIDTIKARLAKLKQTSNQRWLATLEKLNDDYKVECEKNGADSKKAVKIKSSIDAGHQHKPTATEEKLKAELQSLKAGAVQVYEGINFASVPQMKDLLYTKRGFGFKMPDEEHTAKKTLMTLPDSEGFVDDLLLLRSLEKTTSTYLNGIMERLDANDCVHTSFLQHGTASGRLSSRDPNLQNLPDPNRVKNEEAKKVTSYVKQSFIAPPDHYLIQLDYSQAELRIVAEYANEENMIEAYKADRDLHAVTGAKLAGFKSVEDFYEKLDAKDQKFFRTKAKSANFGLLYGMGADGYMQYAKDNYGVDMNLDEAEKSRNDFFTLYPNLIAYHNTYIAKGKKFGYVRTLFGRKRRLPDIHNVDAFKRSMDERVAINSPIQGTAGEFTIFAIALLYLRLPEDIRFVNTVHDSIIFYIPKHKVVEAIELIKQTAENLPTQQFFGRKLEKLSMKVDVEISDSSWKGLSEYNVENFFQKTSK